ncbi:POK25 protein, partial [Grantiella picta]|nr:POK25 protein [Grantiella picta]
IAKGNRRADSLAVPVITQSLPDMFAQAKLCHQLYDQHASALVRMFRLMREQAKAIISTCPSCCQDQLPSYYLGVNPRGLESCQIWQMDITHIAEFGWKKFAHVSIDTSSGAMHATAH